MFIDARERLEYVSFQPLGAMCGCGFRKWKRLKLNLHVTESVGRSYEEFFKSDPNAAGIGQLSPHLIDSNLLLLADSDSYLYSFD